MWPVQVKHVKTLILFGALFEISLVILQILEFYCIASHWLILSFKDYTMNTLLHSIKLKNHAR